MAALYTHTTRATGTILTATIYNADHQNHIDNGIPAQLDDYSVNVAQMQLVTDPGEVGTESLAGNLAGELERLRFAVAEIKNRLNGGVTPQWYATASGAINGTTGTFSGNVSGVDGVFSGNVSGVNGTFTGPVSGTTGTFTGAVSMTGLTATTGTFSNNVSASRAAVGADQTFTLSNTDNTNAASGAVAALSVGGASAGDAALTLAVTGVTTWSVGVDNSDADQFKIGHNAAVGTNTDLRIDTSGNVVTSGSITASSNSAGTAKTVQISNTNNANAASHAELTALTGGASGGDPLLRLEISGVVGWSVGLDNSDSDKFKIGASTAVGTSTALVITAAGSVTFPQPVAFGYDTGAGGTVTQLTSKGTAVTLNKPVGSIVTTSSALAANTSINFQLNDSIIGNNDNIILTFGNGAQSPGAYNVWGQVGPGLATITLKNVTAGSLSEAVTINFAVVKGAVA